jgi:hypothetical protein
MKELNLTGRRIEAPEFLIPMIEFTTPTPSVVSQVTPMLYVSMYYVFMYICLCIRGCTNPGHQVARASKFVRWRLIFVGLSTEFASCHPSVD